MTANRWPRPSALAAIGRGLGRRCPKCGTGALLHRYLKIVDACAACGEAFGHYRPDDAAPWLTILVVGHLTVPIVILVEANYAFATWTQLAVYLPLIVALTLALLPRCKGAILGLMWAVKSEGTEKG